MKRGSGTVLRTQPRPFYDKREGKKPVLLIILPVVMVLVVAATFWLAYRDAEREMNQEEVFAASSELQRSQQSIAGEQ